MARNIIDQVNFSYTPQMSVDAVTGSNTYVSDSKYDAAGRLATRTQGAGLVQTNTYFDWMTANGWGRLQRMTTGSLQDLYYTYDANANILTIRDYKAGNPQTQSFSYDNLDRLHTAAASGGTGGVGNYVSQTYDYSTSSGNLSSKAGLTLSYTESDHPHAVSAYNGNTYSYDANGNQTTRRISSITYNLTYDLENRLVAAGSGYTGKYVYDGDGKRVKETGVYKNLASGIVATCDVSIGNADVVTNGDTYADSGSGASREFGNVGSGLHYVQIDLGAVYSVNKVKVWHYNRDGRTYHNTKTQVSSDGVSWYTVFDSAVSGEYAETSAGKTHTFTTRSVRYVRDWLNGSTANTGNHWVEIEAWGYASTAYVGDHFEWNGSTRTMTRYYYAGGQRVAVRNSDGSGTDGLVFLINDHLGSTSLSSDPLLGQKLTELRYMPWGEGRYSGFFESNMPTDNRYTGQKSEMAALGLYFYNARMYDPALGRFLSADTLIPEPYDSQSWDRYAAMANNPVRFTDPTGHCPWCIVGALVGAAAGYGIQVYNNYQNGYSGSDAWTQNIQAETIIGGALVGAGAVIFAPAAVAAAGDVLVGAGVATSSSTLFGAGLTAYGASSALGNAIAGTPAISTGPALNTPNEIGAWGEQQVGSNLPVNIQQQRVIDPVTGQARIYDGNFTNNPGAYVEVKTSLRGSVYATQSVRNQIAFDSNMGVNSGTSPTWIFVNAQPSKPLVNLMQQSRIPWHQLKVPLE